MLEDGRSAPITRSACAAYLASFLARGKFVSDDMVVGALQAMVNWAARCGISCSQVPVTVVQSSIRALGGVFR